MLRKFLTAMALALVGLFAATGVASAAPGDYGPVTIITNVTIINNGGVVVIGGGGFSPGETINITIVYPPPPRGLRLNKALKLATLAAAGQTALADSSGHFTAGLTLTQVGTATITATGQISGNTVSTTVTVLAAGASTPPGTTTVAGSTATGSPGSNGSGSNGSGSNASGNDTSSGGLASTGASIAGPLTVGASALIAGLALLFFGTRLAIRRSSGRTAHR